MRFSLPGGSADGRMLQQYTREVRRLMRLPLVQALVVFAFVLTAVAMANSVVVWSSTTQMPHVATQATRESKFAFKAHTVADSLADANAVLKVAQGLDSSSLSRLSSTSVGASSSDTQTRSVRSTSNTAGKQDQGAWSWSTVHTNLARDRGAADSDSDSDDDDDDSDKIVRGRHPGTYALVSDDEDMNARSVLLDKVMHRRENVLTRGAKNTHRKSGGDRKKGGLFAGGSSSLSFFSSSSAERKERVGGGGLWQARSLGFANNRWRDRWTGGWSRYTPFPTPSPTPDPPKFNESVTVTLGRPFGYTCAGNSTRSFFHRTVDDVTIPTPAPTSSPTQNADDELEGRNANVARGSKGRSKRRRRSRRSRNKRGRGRSKRKQRGQRRKWKRQRQKNEKKRERRRRRRRRRRRPTGATNQFGDDFWKQRFREVAAPESKEQQENEEEEEEVNLDGTSSSRGISPQFLSGAGSHRKLLEWKWKGVPWTGQKKETARARAKDTGGQVDWSKPFGQGWRNNYNNDWWKKKTTAAKPKVQHTRESYCYSKLDIGLIRRWAAQEKRKCHDRRDALPTPEPTPLPTPAPTLVPVLDDDDDEYGDERDTTAEQDRDVLKEERAAREEEEEDAGDGWRSSRKTRLRGRGDDVAGTRATSSMELRAHSAPAPAPAPVLAAPPAPMHTIPADDRLVQHGPYLPRGDVRCRLLREDHPENICNARYLALNVSRLAEMLHGEKQADDLPPDGPGFLGHCHPTLSKSDVGHGVDRWLAYSFQELSDEPDGPARTFGHSASPATVCDRWITHPVYAVRRWDARNPYHAHEDLIHAFTAYSVLDVDASDVQVMFLDRAGSGVYDDIWQTAYSPRHTVLQPQDILSSFSTVINVSVPPPPPPDRAKAADDDGDSLVQVDENADADAFVREGQRPAGAARARAGARGPTTVPVTTYETVCFSNIFFNVHGGISPLSRNKDAISMCGNAPLVNAMVDFHLRAFGMRPSQASLECLLSSSSHSHSQAAAAQQPTWTGPPAPTPVTESSGREGVHTEEGEGEEEEEDPEEERGSNFGKGVEDFPTVAQERGDDTGAAAIVASSLSSDGVPPSALGRADDAVAATQVDSDSESDSDEDGDTSGTVMTYSSQRLQYIPSPGDAGIGIKVSASTGVKGPTNDVLDVDTGEPVDTADAELNKLLGDNDNDNDNDNDDVDDTEADDVDADPDRRRLLEWHDREDEEEEGEEDRARHRRRRHKRKSWRRKRRTSRRRRRRRRKWRYKRKRTRRRRHRRKRTSRWKRRRRRRKKAVAAAQAQAQAQAQKKKKKKKKKKRKKAPDGLWKMRRSLLRMTRKQYEARVNRTLEWLDSWRRTLTQPVHPLSTFLKGHVEWFELHARAVRREPPPSRKSSSWSRDSYKYVDPEVKKLQGRMDTLEKGQKQLLERVDELTKLIHALSDAMMTVHKTPSVRLPSQASGGGAGDSTSASLVTTTGADTHTAVSTPRPVLNASASSDPLYPYLDGFAFTLNATLVVRKDYGKRKVERQFNNLPALIQALQTLPFLNLRIIDFANYTIAQQLEIASSTELLIGAHGAGLTNCMYMPRYGGLIEIQDTSRQANWHFGSISTWRGLYFDVLSIFFDLEPYDLRQAVVHAARDILRHKLAMTLDTPYLDLRVDGNVINAFRYQRVRVMDSFEALPGTQQAAPKWW